MNGPHDEALRIASLGMAVFPLHTNDDGSCSCRKPDCPSPAKHPRTAHGLSDATRDPEKIREWWTRWPKANVGIATGAPSGIVVLDLDPKNGGDDGMTGLREEFGDLPETRTVLTGGGGAHFYFLHPGTEVRNSAGKVGLGLDVRADGGYVVAPPSKHISGGDYSWANDVPIAPLPPWLLLLMAPPKPQAPPPVQANHTTNGSAYGASALGREVSAVACAPEGTRNDRLNVAAFNLGQLVSAGVLDRGTVERSLLGAAIGASLSPSEATGVIERGLEAGMSTPRQIQQPAPQPTTTEERARPSSVDIADLLASDPPQPPDELIEHLVVRPGVVVVFGASGSGKSYALLMGLYDLIQGGGTFCGVDGFQIRPETGKYGGEPDRVLWVYGTEDNEARMHRRAIGASQHGPHAGKPAPGGRFFIAQPPAAVCLASEPGLAWLRREIVARKATIVVLDTIQSLVSSINVSKGEDVGPFMVALHRLRDEFQLVIFPVHHTAKAPQDAKAKIRSKADTLLGSQAWRALADGVIMLDATDGDASRADLRLIKGKDVEDPPAPVALTMDSTSKRFRPLEDDEVAPVRTDVRKGGRPSKTSVEAVLALRPAHPLGIEWKRLPGLLGAAEGTFRNRARELQTELLALGHVIVGDVLRWNKQA